MMYEVAPGLSSSLKLAKKLAKTAHFEEMSFYHEI